MPRADPTDGRPADVSAETPGGPPAGSAALPGGDGDLAYAAGRPTGFQDCEQHVARRMEPEVKR